ncbi:nuclease domain-containing protein [Pseudomonas aeruginosa]
MAKIASKAVRDAARDEECTVRIAGICNYRTDTTVFAHLPDESKGMGEKADDLSGCFACSACHDALDGRRKHDLSAEEVEWYMRRALVRTWRRLFEKRVMTIKGAAA